MAKKARQRITYVLEGARSSAGGHRLGVNGLAVDRDNSILYSGGREGIVCAWDLNLDLNSPNSSPDNASATKDKAQSKLRVQTQAHMGWINDIALAQNNTALVTASSDLTVKVWRPHSEEASLAQPIGEHSDYAMRLTTPPADMGANWVASGGLDRKICLWDLNGGGKTLDIDVQGEDIAAKGSIYSLCAGRNIIASGGPEKTVRIYDTRSGEKVSKLVGHLDNIRSILIDEASETILSASSDKTIKMWSLKNGRCIYTFTMHEESVWSLYSDDPRLGVFYSADRSGLVAKTNVRGSMEDIDDGLSLAVVQEHSSIFKVVAAGGHIWTGTEQSSINRWPDINMSSNMQLPDSHRRDRAHSSASKRPRESSVSSNDAGDKKEIPPQSILRISNTATFPSRTTTVSLDSPPNAEGLPRKLSEVVVEQTEPELKPLYAVPAETIEGQFGLLKHRLLNDRRRVLTLDTDGEVLMWDLIKCIPIQKFGKQQLDDVERVVNTREAVAPWCSVDSSSGNLSVVLEPYNCFDAEVYADELQLDEPIEFREDQRISLGKWILRYLFANLIDEEIKRDEKLRQELDEGNEKKHPMARANAPTSIELPRSIVTESELSDKVVTPRATGSYLAPATPGLAIGLATPGPITTSLQGVPEGSVSTPMSPLEKRMSHASRQSVDRDDYFTSTIGPADGAAKPAGTPATPAAESADPKSPGDTKGKEKASENGKSTFGKFRMSFGSKKLGRSASTTAQEKPAIVDEKAEESESSSNHEKEVDDSFYGVIQKIRNDYERQSTEHPDRPVETGITPSLPGDTPVLKLPPKTRVTIQEETTGGSATIYQGTVATVGNDAEVIEQKAPMWLGHLLLQNQIPYKDPVKVSFVLHPLDDLPAIATADGNNRLNANRMLRVKKILAYVSERIEKLPEEPEVDALKPEEYLELYCNDQLLDPLMSLATLRTHVWKGGNDIVLHYKSNGRKEIQIVQPAPTEAVEAGEPTQQDTQGGGETGNTTTNQQA